MKAVFITKAPSMPKMTKKLGILKIKGLALVFLGVLAVKFSIFSEVTGS
jgi:hypothetical protein